MSCKISYILYSIYIQQYLKRLMEFEASFTLRQIREQLRRKKYKFVVNRVSKLLQKQEELPYSSKQFVFMAIYYQTSAVNKLLERNLMKKYKYHSHLVEYLSQLLLQNLKQCHEIISEEIICNTIFQANTKSPDVNIDFPLNGKRLYNQNRNVMSSHQLSFKSSVKLINHDQMHNINRHMQLFLRLINNSFVFLMQTMDVYCVQTSQLDNVADFVLSMSALKFAAISDFLSQIKLKLYFGKLLSAQQETLKSQKIIQEVTENLLDILHMINITISKLSKYKQEYKINKYEEQHKECFKLILIAIIISNKNHMKLGKESIAALGVQIFKISLQGLTPKYSGFRKLMLPQLYLQQQFLRYRAEKQELAQIVSLYFNDKKQQIQESNREKLSSNTNTILDFYNKQHNPCVQIVVRPKIAYCDINTVKSIGALTIRKGGTTTALRTISQEEDASDRKSNILTKMIINELDQINSSYLKFKATSSRKENNPNKTDSRKPSFYKIQSSQLLKKQRLGSSRCVQDASQRSIDVTALKRKFQQGQREFQKIINRSKERLTRKNRQKVLHLIQNPVQEEQVIREIRKIDESEHFLKSYIYPQQKIIQIAEKDLKKSMLAIVAKKRTQMFLQILIQNREALGIKKIAEKLEALRKKQQEKLKMLSNRLTSSINRSNMSFVNHNQHQKSNFNKLQVVAKQILKRHISFQVSKVNPIQKTYLQSDNKQKLIEANYTLGQKSIDTIKRKLQSKMNKGQKVVDKYHKNQEVFKLKLKKLGTTNFILKKAQEEADNKESSLFDY